MGVKKVDALVKTQNALPPGGRARVGEEGEKHFFSETYKVIALQNSWLEV
jgi:hypothetical protein